MTFGQPVPTQWAEGPLDEILERLKNHLQQAVLVELYTIPMYLYAAYSIKDSGPRSKVIGVVMQEMLHLGLAGNILCSVGGSPRLYGDGFTPTYPNKIFKRDVEMNLSPGTKETIEIFKEIEMPAQALELNLAASLLPEYKTIGEFYLDLRDGLQIVHDRFQNEQGRNIFLEEKAGKQFNENDGSWNDDQMKTIKDIKTATDSLDLIIEQGEGSLASRKDSHYEIFDTLGREGSWKSHNVVTNIRPEDYPQERFYKLMKAADASYSYLLMSLEKLWDYDGEKRPQIVENNITGLMFFILKPLALFLVKQAISGQNDDPKHAAVPFRLHVFTSAPDSLTELKQITEDALDMYREGDKFDPNLENSLKSNLEKVVQGLSSLVDLKDF